VCTLLLLTGCHHHTPPQEENSTVVSLPTQEENTTSTSEEDINSTIEVSDTNITDENSTEESNSSESTDENSSIEEEASSVKSFKEDTQAKEWYVRVVVEDVTNNIKNDSAQLGQLDQEGNLSQYALRAIDPFGGRYLDVVFQNPEGLEEGSYKSCFHPSKESEDSWEFTIKSSDSNANLIVSWRGLYVLESYVDDASRTQYKEYRSMRNSLLSYMVLVDLDSNEEIAVLSHGKVNAIEVAMDGEHERHLAWRLKDHSQTSKLAPSFKRVEEDSADLQKREHLNSLRKAAKEKVRTLDFEQPMTPPHFKVLEK
jgi:hypothetical protein